MDSLVKEFKNDLLNVFNTPTIMNYYGLKIKYLKDNLRNTIKPDIKSEAMLLITKIEVITNKPFYALDSLSELISYFDYNFRYGTDMRMQIMEVLLDFIDFLREENALPRWSVNTKVFNRLLVGKYRKLLDDVYIEKINYTPIFRHSIERRSKRIRKLKDYLTNIIFEYKCFEPMYILYASLIFLGLDERALQYVKFSKGITIIALMMPMYDYKIGKYREVKYLPQNRLEGILFKCLYNEYGTDIGKALYNANEERNLYLGATTYITSGRRNYINTMNRKYKYPVSDMDNIFKSSLSNLISISAINKIKESELGRGLLKEIVSTDADKLLSYSIELYDRLIKSDDVEYLFADAEDIYNYNRYKNNIIFNNNLKFKKLKGFNKKYSV